MNETMPIYCQEKCLKLNHIVQILKSTWQIRKLCQELHHALQIGKGCGAVSISFPTEDETIEYLKEQEENLWD